MGPLHLVLVLQQRAEEDVVLVVVRLVRVVHDLLMVDLHLDECRHVAAFELQVVQDAPEVRRAERGRVELVLGAQVGHLDLLAAREGHDLRRAPFGIFARRRALELML